jgi:hypothetical protein
MSLRFKLATSAIAVMLTANLLLSIATLKYLESVWMQEVSTRVPRNLNSARAAYLNRIEETVAFLHGAALERGFRKAINLNAQAELWEILGGTRRSSSVHGFVRVVSHQEAPHIPRRKVSPETKEPGP